MRLEAINLCKAGFRVIPLVGKRPFETDWPARAFSEPFDVFECWPGEQYNVGVVCGHGLFVVDVDVKGGKPGAQSLAKLVAQHGPLPETRTVRTPSGGWHYYFRTPDGSDVANATDFLKDEIGAGVDIKGAGGQVVAPGSVYAGRAYVLESDAPIATAPAWLLSLLHAPRTKSADAGNVVCATDTPEDLARCRQWIAASPDVYEGGRDNAAFAAAARCADLGAQHSLRELLDEWNEAKCNPPLDDADLDRITASALKNRQKAIGCDSCAVLSNAFTPVEGSPGVPAKRLLEFPRDISVEEILERQGNDLLEGIIGIGDLGMIYGDSTVGKSFAAIDLFWHIATGKRWAGRRTEISAVLYASLEGIDGFRKRMKSAEIKLGDPGNHFARLNIPVTFARASGAQAEQSIRDIIESYQDLMAASGAGQGVIVIDTLAHAIAGDDENSSQDMMHFYNARCGAIRAATGAAIILIHHTNKEGEARGSSANKPAFDVMIKATRDPKTGVRTLYAEKVKDGPEQKLMDYRLRVVELGLDRHGKPATSCVVEPVIPAVDERAEDCFRVTGKLMKDAIERGLRLSPDSRTRKDKDGAEKYAARWLVQNFQGDRGFTVEEFAAALEKHVGFSLEIEAYDSNGKRPKRYVLKGSPPPSDSSPTDRISDSSDTSPTDAA